MNYDKAIVELLTRIATLEEKVTQLEQALLEKNTTIEHAHKSKPKTRDKTRYFFNGEIYLKNKLVLAVVRAYVSDHTETNINDLKTTFHDNLQGSFGVVRQLSDVEEKKQIRYFCKEDDKIQLSDGTVIVVSNQWDKNRIKTFINAATKLGYDIREVK